MRPALRRSANSAFLALAVLVASALVAPEARALDESSPLHWSGDQTSWDRRTNVVRLEGHARVSQPGETLSADFIVLDLENRTVEARGSCFYYTTETVMQGDEMYFNLDTRTGTIIGGRVSSDRFTLTGERINKLGVRRFQTHRGEYSTCHDCPQSWTLRGDDVDLEFEGYAYMSNVTAKVKEAPLFWLPYLVVPVKTQRQTGLLFPKLGFAGEGFRYVLPFYWAINRSSDLTIGAGEYGGRGFRLETEGRYRLSERSAAQANLNYLYDTKFLQRPNRWSLNVEQSQELPSGVLQKLRILEVSDNNYPTTFGDIPGQNEAFIASDLIFSHSTSQVSVYLAARRFRNLLNLASDLDFDPSTVQAYPTLAVQTNDRSLLDRAGIVGGLRLGLTNFTRGIGPFDRNPGGDRPGAEPFAGFDPIRVGTRYSATPSAYTTFRPWDVVALVPSFEYRAYYYDFHGAFDRANRSATAPMPGNLARGYGLLRADLSTQWERIFETSNPDIPRVKHLFRPILSYSYIPFVNSDESHPFIRQIEYARDHNFSGFNFDNDDIVPFEGSKTYTNYYIPLGNSLSYGFTTQLIRRRGAVDAPGAGYQRSVELRAGQTVDFREFREGGGSQPFSRFFSNLGFEFDRWSSGTDYVYVPYLPLGAEPGNRNSFDQNRHVFATSMSYVFDRSVHQQFLAFERSFSLGYVYNIKRESATNNLRATLTYSLSDYILPSVYVSYDLITRRYQEVGASLRFQSPSRCWRIDLSASGSLCREGGTDGFCIQRPNIDLSLNLTGEGFGGVSQVTGGGAK